MASYLAIAGSVFLLIEGALLGELLVLVAGLFLFVVGLLVYAEPHHHLANGILAILLAVLGLLFGLGGFYVGSILGIIGGVAAVVWSPPRSPVQAMASMASPRSPS